MGQTLTHGVYLPNEGERNCYNGLASNWRLLDGAIGTVAAHTTAIAEKADISHTHGNITSDGKVGTTANVPLITGTGGVVQAGSFGTSANTFCEGNDSRLSDARTPVAHTHTKSDVTDLLNSNFIPSANNSYDLGSSSYQWNNLYAKNYFYNGVAWGLDKANVYSLEQTISATSGKSWNVKNTNYTLGENTPSLNKLVGAFAVQDNDDNNAFLFNLNHYSNGEVISRWLTRFKFTNGVKSTTGTQKAAVIEMGLTNSGDRFARPGTNGDMDLGTSSFRWKTLNGINPGALSLPNIYDSYDVVTTNWSTAYNQPNDLKINGADPSYPGWLFIRLDNCTAADDFVIVRYFHVNATNLTFFGSFIPTASSYVLSVPIQAGITTKVWVSKIPTTCKYYACLGTVK